MLLDMAEVLQVVLSGDIFASRCLKSLAIILVILALIWLVALFFLKIQLILKPLSTFRNAFKFSTFGENLGVVDIYKNSKNLVVKLIANLQIKKN